MLFKSFKLWRWQRALALDKHLAVFDRLFLEVNGFTLSMQARAHNDAIDYVYGEINFISFIALLSLAHPDENTVFYDLGSGTGKAVIACAMVYPVKKSCGIELFSLLHLAAIERAHDLQAMSEYKSKAAHIHFINQDFLQTPLDDASLIFVNATAFFGETWDILSQKLANTINCKTVITTSKKLRTDAFIVTHETIVEMSWGFVKAYVQQRF